MKAKSFAELEQAECVLTEELQASLREYAVTGAAISARVVKGLIEKTDPFITELSLLIEWATEGYKTQTRLSCNDGAQEYGDVLLFLLSKLAIKERR